MDTWITASIKRDIGTCPNCGERMIYKTREDGTLLTKHTLIDGRVYVMPECRCSSFQALLSQSSNSGLRHLGKVNIVPLDGDA